MNKENILNTLDIFSNETLSSINELKIDNEKSMYIIIFTNKNNEKIYLEISYLPNDLIVHHSNDTTIFHTSGNKKFTLSHFVQEVTEPKLLVFDYMKESDFLSVAQTEYNRSIIDRRETDYGYYIITECTNKKGNITYLTLGIRDTIDQLMHYLVFEVDSEIYKQHELVDVFYSVKTYKM